MRADVGKPRGGRCDDLPPHCLGVMPFKRDVGGTIAIARGG